jgi:hypothetical protein
MCEDADQDQNLSRRVVGGPSVDATSWPIPDEGALSGDRRAQYFARKSAVSQFLASVPPDQIRPSTGLGAKQAYRLVRERCLAAHEDGTLYGWRGLIPNLHIRAYKRRTKVPIDKFGSGGAGVLQLLLDPHPDELKQLSKQAALKFGRRRRPRYLACNALPAASSVG